MATCSVVLAAAAVCHELGSTCFFQYIAVNVWFLLAVHLIWRTCWKMLFQCIAVCVKYLLTEFKRDAGNGFLCRQTHIRHNEYFVPCMLKLCSRNWRNYILSAFICCALYLLICTMSNRPSCRCTHSTPHTSLSIMWLHFLINVGHLFLWLDTYALSSDWA
jgi:hypothetical protein